MHISPEVIHESKRNVVPVSLYTVSAYVPWKPMVDRICKGNKVFGPFIITRELKPLGSVVDANLQGEP
jgi:hypothetical protein